MSGIAVVSLGGEEYGLHVMRIVEVLRSRNIRSVPNLPSFLSGVTNLRGEIIPLIDLRKRFKIEPSGKKEMVVVVRTGGGKIGVIVDSVKEVVNLGDDELHSPPGIFTGLKTEYLSGIAKKGERVIIILNIEGLLTAGEMAEMDNALHADMTKVSGGEGI